MPASHRTFDECSRPFLLPCRDRPPAGPGVMSNLPPSSCVIRRLVHNTRETGQGQWRMNAHCASSHPGRASENGASPLLSSERSTSPLHSQRLRRPGHCGSDPGASHPTPSSAAADPPGILRRKDRHIQAKRPGRSPGTRPRSSRFPGPGQEGFACPLRRIRKSRTMSR